MHYHLLNAICMPGTSCPLNLYSGRTTPSTLTLLDVLPPQGLGLCRGKEISFIPMLD
jgi:hypothetical protein